MVIGRIDSRCDITIKHGTVSESHARIVFADGAFWISDLGSTQGTKRNGQPVTLDELADGDVIAVGDIKLGFQLE